MFIFHPNYLVIVCKCLVEKDLKKNEKKNSTVNIVENMNFPIGERLSRQ